MLTLQKVADYRGFLFIQSGKGIPSDIFIAFPINDLPAGVLPDFGGESFHHLLFGNFLLEIQRKVAVFESEFVHAFV